VQIIFQEKESGLECFSERDLKTETFEFEYKMIFDGIIII